MFSRINTKGFTLVEVLVYAAGVILIVGVIVSILFYTYKWYGEVAAPSRIDQIGVSLADRVENDIRAGQSVNGTGNTFGSNNGALSLTVFNSATTTISRSYALSGGRLTFQEGSGSVQYISPSDVSITEFYLTESSTTNSTAIRFTIGINFKPDSRATTTATSTYTELGILRNSYQ